jgi:hypothetical protein
LFRLQLWLTVTTPAEAGPSGGGISEPAGLTDIVEKSLLHGGRKEWQLMMAAEGAHLGVYKGA